jgi:hypothetical protein
VIVPCGKSKIWDTQPDVGPTPAAEAYTGAPYKLNRQYAERFSDRWVVLSAKYGFIEPDFEIPGPYEVAFTKKQTGPTGIETLRQQVKALRLHEHAPVVGLGGIEYRKAIEAAFAPFNVEVDFPFAGLPIGKMMQATKRPIASGNPGFVPEV